MIVVLPAPDGPIRAAFSPGAMLRLTFRRIETPGLDISLFAEDRPGRSRFSLAYAKETFLMSTRTLFFRRSSTAFGLSVMSGGIVSVSMAVRMAGMFQLIWCSMWPMFHMLSLTFVAYINSGTKTPLDQSPCQIRQTP